MASNVFERFRRALLRNIYVLFIVFFLIFILGYSLTRFNLNNPYSLLAMFSVIAMFIGQLLLFTPLWFSYFFYLFSFIQGILISFMFWLSYHMPYSEFAESIYLIVITVLIAIPLVTHKLTRRRIGTIHIIPIFSVFFLGLLITLSSTQTLSNTSFEVLFMLAILLFTLTSILGLNMAYRTITLNRELKIGDRNQYLRKAKEDLLKRYNSTDAKPDIDLLIYYLSSSLDSFVYGDLDRSFMDAFKIIDNKGTAFKTIYTLHLDEKQWKHLKDIRDRLSHARIRQDKKEEEKEILQILKKLRKTLFRETLEVLRIVHFEFINVALEDQEPRTRKS